MMQNQSTSTSKWKQYFKTKNNKINKNSSSSHLQSKSIIEAQSKKKLEEQIKTNHQNVRDEQKENKQKSNNQTIHDNKKCELPLSKQVNEPNLTEISNKAKQKRLDKQKITNQTKKVIQRLQKKQKQKEQNPDSISSQQQHQINQNKINDKKQELLSQKPKPVVSKIIRGNYKIFKPQLFSNIDSTEEIKTSTHRWTYGTGQTPQQLLLSSWNINGIRARMGANDILPYLKSANPDIFCVNQHKIDEKSFLQNPYEFWGYHSYWNFHKHAKAYSGVAIFSKYPALQMFEDIHIPRHSREGRVITLVFDKFVLVNVYTPTCGQNLQRLKYRVEEYDPAFRQYILKLQADYPTKTLIICGDLNVSNEDIDCHTCWKKDLGKEPSFTYQQRNNFKLLLKQAQLIDTFRHLHPAERKYTWWNMRRGGRDRNGETGIGKRLDYFLVHRDSLKFVKTSEIKQKVKGCDHCPIEMVIDFSL